MKLNAASTSLLLLLLSGSSVLATSQPGHRKGQKAKGNRKEHVVLIDRDDDIPDNVERILNQVSLTSDCDDVRYVYNNTAFRGFAANLDPTTVEALGGMAGVRLVKESRPVSLTGKNTDTTWGLQRISSLESMAGGDPEETTYTYFYPDNNLGAGVDVYIIDSGVNAHHELLQGRASTGWSNAGVEDDLTGHGTHVAGTAAGELIGVASRANIISAQVTDQDGWAMSSTIIAAIDYVIQRHSARTQEYGFIASVINLSLSGTSEFPSSSKPLFPLHVPPSNFAAQLGQHADETPCPVDDAWNDAVRMATEAGVHVVVAAGNDAVDACTRTPARMGGANSAVITVGSVSIDGTISYFSNTGECVDVYAPGDTILSSYFLDSQSLTYMSGTSMACPHVTGLVAYLATSQPSLAASPADMKTYIKAIGQHSLSEGVTVVFNHAAFEIEKTRNNFTWPLSTSAKFRREAASANANGGGDNAAPQQEKQHKRLRGKMSADKKKFQVFDLDALDAEPINLAIHEPEFSGPW